MKVVILCGGKGTRLREYTEVLPKMLVEIGGRPILWHIMKYYSAQGYNDFVLCLGYLGDKIKQFFLDYGGWRHQDFELALAAAPEERVRPLKSPENWRITFVDTGLETQTGGRIKRIARYVNGESFLATYGDGLTNLRLEDLLAFHRRQQRIATLTAINPSSGFGLVDVDDAGIVHGFREKPPISDWINGGFFVFDPAIFEYLEDDSVLERAPFERLAADGQLAAYRHRGFWQCMDTFKDAMDLDRRWSAGDVPWKVWGDE
jgi:glucose-1-phosphate cytidylyltransferase